jgi:formate dehydrogenase major subunit
MIAYTLGDGAKNVLPTVVHIEGDPDSPINAGTLCPKGASTMQLTVNRQRVTTPLYRPAGATDWQSISWNEMLDKIAQKVKETRDRTFVTVDPQGRTVNRQEGFASIGGAAFSNEEGHLMIKLFLIASGTCSRSTGACLTRSDGDQPGHHFRRGAMTNHWRILNTRMMFIVGANPPKPPCGFSGRFRGGQARNEDRPCRPTLHADVGCIGLLHAHSRGQRHRDVGLPSRRRWRTSSPRRLREELHLGALPGENGYDLPGDGYSGWDAVQQTYDTATWAYDTDENGYAKQDLSLQDPVRLPAHEEALRRDTTSTPCQKSPVRRRNSS